MWQNLFTLAVFYSFSICFAELSPLVEIRQGKLRGVVKNDWKGGEYYSFLSIPYARPPIGKLRFMIPVSPQKWDGILEATKDMPPCSQKDWYGKIIGQEDCLYLNVHTPEIITKDLKPVMVFIHGGGYIEGHGRYDMFGPEFLIPERVLLVTINYRLGFLGFMNFENPNVGAFGNMGLKDQNMALKWVHENIEKFGGDPSSVTIFGESAGGASVHMHMLSPMSKGLFHKVISQSGTALNPWNTNGQKNTGVFAAKFLGFQGNSESSMLNFLQEVPIEDIFKVQENASIIIPIHEPSMFAPVVEQKNEELAFLPATPEALISSENFPQVPFMLGATNTEAIIIDVVYLIQTGKLPELLPELTVLHTLRAEDEHTKSEIAKKIASFYAKNNNLNDRTVRMNLGGDAFINWGLLNSVRAHAKLLHQNLYMYLLSADTELNYMKRLHPITAKYPGTSHIDDLGYIFKTKYTPEIQPDSVEAKAMQKVVKLWTNFAKYGDPTPNHDELNLTWNPVDITENIKFLIIGTDSLMMDVNPWKERMEFWDKLHEEYKSQKTVHTEL